MKRRKARETALQLLYAAELRGEDPVELLEEFLEGFGPLGKDQRFFMEQLVRGVVLYGEEIDRALTRAATNWDLGRMGFVDRNILRIAAYELLHLEDVPTAVAIDEAIEIAKRFGSSDSPKFINGILNCVKEQKPGDSPRPAGVRRRRMKKTLSLLLKILISAGLVVFLLRSTDLPSLAEVLRSASLPLICVSYVVIFLNTLLLTARWYWLVRPHCAGTSLSFLLFWRLTLIGMFFNVFLPTGAGGDVAKAFYLVRGEDRKMVLAGSVLVDRIVGSFTLALMALAAILLTRCMESMFLSALAMVLVLTVVFILLANRSLTRLLFDRLSRMLPVRARRQLIDFYGALSGYIRRPSGFLPSLGISIVLQAASVVTVYLLALALFPGTTFPMSAGLFFIFVPLVWITTVVPSIGGLGIRESAYVLLFSSYLGKEKALALSLMVLGSILFEAIPGAVLFILTREQATTEKTPSAPAPY